MMRFKLNSCVKITEEADFGGDHVAAGTKARITEILPAALAYRVRFDGLNRDVITLEEVLEPC